MIKHVFSTLTFSLFTSIGVSQTVFEIKDSFTSNIITNGVNIANTTVGGYQTNNDFEIKNTSTVTQTLTVRRYDDLLNKISMSDSASASYCTGTNCYSPITKMTSFVLAANTSIVLKADLQEASVIGESAVRYKVNNVNNVNDALTFTIKYNAPVSIKNNANVLSNVSDVFPNPSISKASITITSTQNAENIKVSIINSLGVLVSTKLFDVSVGKNTVTLDVDNLSTGLYFATIYQGSQRITKKITISK